MKPRDFCGAKWVVFPVIGLLCGCASSPLTQTQNAVVEAELSSPAPSATTAETSGSQDALALWQRTLDAPRTAPVRASVVVTRFGSGTALPAISRYEVLEAPGGRKFRITYHAPQSAAGRIVLCDGTTVWQYEPNHDTVLHRPVSTSPVSQDAQSGVADTLTPLPKGAFVTLEPEADSVAGRTVRVLALHAASNGLVSERRWVDTRTGRTLRSETYDASGKKKRRVEMTSVVFSPPITPGDFTPDLAPGVRIVDTAPGARSVLPENRKAAEDAARRVHLPIRAKHFVLQSAQTAQQAQASAKTTHLIYSDGAAAVSVFVTPVGKANAVLQGANGWKPARLSGADAQTQIWTQETAAQTAIAWTQNHTRMVAVAQMPVRDLLPLVQVFASDRSSNPVHKTP